MTSRTFLCEGHRHTDLDCVEQNVFGSHQPWPLEINPNGHPELTGTLLPNLLSGKLIAANAKWVRKGKT